MFWIDRGDSASLRPCKRQPLQLWSCFQDEDHRALNKVLVPLRHLRPDLSLDFPLTSVKRLLGRFVRWLNRLALAHRKSLMAVAERLAINAFHQLARAFKF